MLIDWLAAGLEPRGGDAVRAVARARARRTASAAVDDHAAGLARARADATRISRSSSRRRIWPPTGSWATRCCRAPTSCCTGRPSCRWARTRSRTWRSRARSRAASITCTAASRTSKHKAERAVKSLGGRNITLLPPAAPQLPGDRATLTRSSARARWCRATTASPWPIASGCSGYLEGAAVSILPEPQVLLTATPRVPGLDGRKMSKSYGNTIGLREDPDVGGAEAAHHADRSGARAAHRSGRSGEVPGVGSAQDLLRRGDPRSGCSEGCRTAGIGCLDCKKPLIERRSSRRSRGMRKRAQEFEDNPELVRSHRRRGRGEGARGRARRRWMKCAARCTCAPD